MRIQTLLRAIATTSTIAIVSASCSSDNTDGPTASTSARLGVATNYQAAGFNVHYASTVAAKFPGTGVWHWVTAFDNVSSSYPTSWKLFTDANGAVGWSYSSDLTGSSWTPNNPPANWEETNWIPPGVPTGGGTFKGWVGDPTLAIVGGGSGPPPDGTQVMMASVVASTKEAKPTDIATLLSKDGGQTWGSPQYIDQPTGGADADQPLIVSNPQPPFSTFVAWSSNSSFHIPPPVPMGWITSINNSSFQPGSSTSAPTTWPSPFQPKQILGIPNNNIVRPKIAVGTNAWANSDPLCKGPPHELVFVTWTTNPYGRECTMGGTVPVAFNLAVFDNTANKWYPGNGTSYFVDQDNNWPLCVGGTKANYNENISNMDVATDGSAVAIVHDRSSSRGTRIQLNKFAFSCAGGNLVGVPLGVALAPDPCYGASGGWGWCGPSDGGTSGNGSDGGTVINDQWGPHIAYQVVGGAPKLLVTWYDTSGDPTQATVKINGAMNSSGLLGNPFVNGTTPTIFPVSIGVSGQVVPWPQVVSKQYIGQWWDYQGIGIDYSTQTFLASWGGDARLVPSGGPSGVWTAHITP